MSPDVDELVPDSVIPHQTLPPLRYRDLPEAPPWKKLVGPSIILAGLALGSGEFVFWPYITYKSGFVFFWACMLGVLTQFFVNMEIERWTLVTGESAITGFCRLSRHWAWVFLILNFVPWMWPGWATGAGTLVSWMAFGANEVEVVAEQPLPADAMLLYPSDRHGIKITDGRRSMTWRGTMDAADAAGLKAAASKVSPEVREAVDKLVAQVHRTRGIAYKAPWSEYIALATMLFVGIALTSGPVVYNTVERMQTYLVGLILVIAVLLGVLFIRSDAVVAMLRGTISIGAMPPPSSELGLMAILGALAFAGAGGSMNLGQSNFIKDKGYGMGKYIGRITSPITGNEEAIADVGYHFKHTPENMSRWKTWWRAANIEHFVSFYLTCVVCLVLMSLIAYSLIRDPSGNIKPGMDRFGEDMNFVWGEAQQIGASYGAAGGLLRVLFFVMGIAILFTTELGVLDAVSRIGADILKVNYLRNNDAWPLGRLYFTLLWSMIALGCTILLAGQFIPNFRQPLFLLKTAAAMNGGVMFIYCVILLYMNSKILSRSLAIGPFRFLAMVWACAFFGYFTMLALQIDVWPFLKQALGFPA